MFPQKVNVKVAAPSKKTKFDKSHCHPTTSDFYQLGVGLADELVPGSDVKLKTFSYVRAEPMVKPTLGLASLHHRYYFVPFSLIDPRFDALIADSIYHENTSSMFPSQTRQFKIDALASMFFNVDGTAILHHLGSVQLATNITEAQFIGALRNSDCLTVRLDNTDFKGQADFVSCFVPGSPSVDSSYHFYKLTNKGRRFYRLMRQLGYNFDLSVNFNDVANYDVCAYPLLCLAKLYIDHYYNYSYYSGSGDFAALRRIVDSVDAKQSLSLSDLCVIFGQLDIMYYQNDYFVSAFDRPTGPNTMFNDITIKDVTADNNPSVVTTEVGGLENRTPYILGDEGSEPSPTNFTQYIDTVLKKVTDYVTRARLVGGLIKERLLARYGLEPTIEKLKISKFLGDSTVNIVFGDVFSTADTDGAALGAFAGKGEAKGADNGISFTATEFGILFDTFYIAPRHGYFQGIDRKCLRLTKFDFFSPEFDCVGAQAISASEVTLPNDGRALAFGDYDYHQNVFGFQLRYADYKFMSDKLTGDFSVPSYMNTESAWHFMRMISPLDFISGQDDAIVHSQNFTQASDRSRYDRCFNTDLIDNFKIMLVYDYQVYAPLKSLYDGFDLDSEGKTISMFLEGNNH